MNGAHNASHRSDQQNIHCPAAFGAMLYIEMAMWEARMSREYSIAEARRQFAGIVRDVKSDGAVQITRRGKRVAVLLSAAEYDRLTGQKPDLWEALQEWRKTADWKVLGDLDDVWADVRDRSPGRDLR